jgi:hypothetical protein
LSPAEAALRRIAPAAEWCFRNWRTGQITIAQWPNLPLGLFVLLKAGELLRDKTDGIGLFLRWGARGCLCWWAADEVLRGVNPWRHLLGAATLAYLVWEIATAA